MPQKMWTPPSLAALRAFETAARTLSFTSAAIELNQTQGAVSHQVNTLEARLGVKLFEREARGLKLTEAGGRYLPFVRKLLDRLRTAEDLIRLEPAVRPHRDRLAQFRKQMAGPPAGWILGDASEPRSADQCVIAARGLQPRGYRLGRAARKRRLAGVARDPPMRRTAVSRMQPIPLASWSTRSRACRSGQARAGSR